MKIVLTTAFSPIQRPAPVLYVTFVTVSNMEMTAEPKRRSWNILPTRKA